MNLLSNLILLSNLTLLFNSQFFDSTLLQLALMSFPRKPQSDWQLSVRFELGHFLRFRLYSNILFFFRSFHLDVILFLKFFLIIWQFHNLILNILIMKLWNLIGGRRILILIKWGSLLNGWLNLIFLLIPWFLDRCWSRIVYMHFLIFCVFVKSNHIRSHFCLYRTV